MHQAMPGPEEMMDQCVAMMGMIQRMPGMMGGNRPGMMDGESMRDVQALTAG